MKDWQKGIQLDVLIDIQNNSFEEFNNNVLSPFYKMKKNRVAEAIDHDHLFVLDNSALHYKKLKVSGRINRYSGYNIPMFKKEKNDILISRISPSDNTDELEKMIEQLHTLTKDNNVIAFALNNCKLSKFILDEAGFEFVDHHYNTFADIIDVYYKDSIDNYKINVMFQRSKIKHEDLEYEDIKKANNIDIINEVNEIKNKLNQLYDLNILSYENHYSNYNKQKSWSALSIKGFSEDIQFINKPSEMGRKWKKDHQDIEYKLQFTELYNQFNNDNINIIEQLFNKMNLNIQRCERIRIMKLSKNSGTLERHTDQGCPDTGIIENKLMRIHIPIKTNNEVKFHTWIDSDENITHMEYGSAYYLDTRKPHKAVNNGDEDRIHLVFDYSVDEQIKKYF